MPDRHLTIAGRTISDDTDAYVIAEIGHNHEGNITRAEQLVRCAAEAGANAVKLQKRHNESLYTRAMYHQAYRGRHSYGLTYGAHREALEFGHREYRRLIALAGDLGIDLLCTAFDFPSVDFLVDMDVPAIKIASGDLTNTPLLSYAAKAGRPVIVSSGAGSLDDVRRACEAVLPVNDQLAVLQCTAVYPAPPALVHLSVITTLRREFPSVLIGFSGHDIGPELSWVAFALGARIIEKHVTLDQSRPGSDHHFSLEPRQLGALVTGLRRTREALGDPVKRALPEEAPALHKMGKKLVAARNLEAGQVLTEGDVAIKSPGGDGLAPYHLSDVLGRPLRTSLQTDGALEFDMLA